MDRRTMLKTAAAVAAAPVLLFSSSANATAWPDVSAPAGASASAAPSVSTAASPALLEAHGRLVAALAEQREAKDALEWIADEWRHLWPLAPEELLRNANADRSSMTKDTAERDIIGNYLCRDTSDLTKRMTAKMRRETRRTCFSIETTEEAQETIDAWAKRVPSGRTEKALAQNQANRMQVIEKYSRKLVLAGQYEAETKRLREVSGVNRAHQNIADAELNVISICSEISRMPAANLSDLAIKGEALRADGLLDKLMSHSGFVGELAVFVRQTIELAPVFA